MELRHYLILVRHSLPEIDESIPAREWYLSEEGRARCQPLAIALSAYAPEVFISSTEPKAIETAILIANHFNLSSVALEDLHEHERKRIPFTSREEFETNVAAFFNQPNQLVLGEETADQAHQRFSAAIKQVIDTYPDKNIAVVTHGTVMTLFISHLIDLDPFSFWRSLGLPAFVVLSLPDLRLVKIVEEIVETKA